MPERMLVPPIYPFTVPLDTGQRCSRETRCLMCTLPLARNDASIGLTKSKIREWADTIGYLALSTQSVFLGRESLPRNLPEILECLRSEEISGIIAGKLQYDFEANLGNRIRSWGNLAKFSSFARPSEINAMGAGELDALRKLGLSTVFISAETGSDRIRREALGKEYENGEIESAVDKVLRAGMACKVIFMLGIGGEKSRPEHVESTAALMSRLVSLAEKKFRLMFLFSPLEFDCAGAHLQREVGRPGMADMMSELHEIGKPEMDSSGLSSYTSIGAKLALPDNVSAHFQIYHYPSLFV
jgi:hypothetical protein